MRRLMLVSTALLALAACRVSTTSGNNQAVEANAAAPTAAATAPVSLARLDCGKMHIDDMDKMFAGSTGVYPPGPRDITDSCYLIRHGDQIMLWDTGLSDSLVGHPMTEPGQQASMDRSVVDQLKQLGIKPEQIGFVGISHYHADHTGQAHLFPNATLLIGAPDLDALKAKTDDQFMQMSQKQMEHWTTGGGKAEPLTGDKDVFGDGSVVMLDLPGHTPGHHSLLVKLKSGAVLLSGDLYHSDLAREKKSVAVFNTDKAATLKSFDRFEALAKETGAKVIIGHEPADVAKLPAFPSFAE